jgi:carbon storage regulator CsrA
MLVLTRRPDESIVFTGLGITVRVLDVRGKSVRLGVEAPPAVRVFRAELLGPPGGEPGGPPAPTLV